MTGRSAHAQGARILVVEDERPMRTVLAGTLEAEGYRVLTASDGQAGLAMTLEEKPDLVLLDIMMPRLDGLSVCAAMRRGGATTPVLLLTARGRVEDRVAGLDTGADDYLVKPFSTDELLARVRALLRRSRRAAKAVSRLVLGEIVIDLDRQVASKGAEPIPLTSKEFGVLRVLAEAGGEPVTREHFLDVVWGCTAFPTTRTVDNHVASLRAKIEDEPESPRWIKTVHGVGYRLDVDIAEP